MKDKLSEDSQEAHVFSSRRRFFLESLIQSESAVGVRRKTNWLYWTFGDHLLADNMATSNAFCVFDTDTWKQLGTAQTSIPFWSATLSADGWFIYAFAPRQHAILEIDAATLREKRKFSLGKTHALAVVAP